MDSRLREFREKIGFSQEKLAEIAGVSRTTIYLIENGRADVVKTDTLSKLADALGGSITDIFFSSKNPTC